MGSPVWWQVLDPPNCIHHNNRLYIRLFKIQTSPDFSSTLFWIIFAWLSSSADFAHFNAALIFICRSRNLLHGHWPQGNHRSRHCKSSLHGRNQLKLWAEASGPVMQPKLHRQHGQAEHHPRSGRAKNREVTFEVTPLFLVTYLSTFCLGATLPFRSHTHFLHWPTKILGTKQFYSFFSVFLLFVFSSLWSFFGHLVIYLLGPLDLVLCTSSLSTNWFVWNNRDKTMMCFLLFINCSSSGSDSYYPF